MDIGHRVKILQNETVWANAAKMPQEAWHEMCVKPWHPELAMVGMRVLSQVISASSCERNWSAHGHIQTKIRNKLSPETTDKLVHVYSNSKTQARRHRGQLPPFCRLVGKHQDVFPGGASALRTRYGRLSNAPRHLRSSEALCTGRGASRRRPTSVAASGSSLPAALARRAPKAGVRPGGALTARPPRSAGRGPRGRRSGPPACSARASPSLSPADCPHL